MWAAKGNNIEMTQGDYGVQLPIVISGPTLTSSDAVKFTLKDGVGGAIILEKTFTNISSNTINLELTAAESATLQPRSYVYNLDWYQSGNFLCNIIGNANFKVVGKA
jgi:hypothetical protein